MRWFGELMFGYEMETSLFERSETFDTIGTAVSAWAFGFCDRSRTRLDFVNVQVGFLLLWYKW